MGQMTFDEILAEPPEEEGDDSVNTPSDAPDTSEDDMEDVDDDESDG